MNLQKKQNNESWFFRLFYFLIELIGWFQIMLSPLLLGSFIGLIIYASYPSKYGFIIGVITSLLGLIIGVIWATKEWNNKGTQWFMSRIMASPDLDSIKDKEINNTDNVKDISKSEINPKNKNI